jgi:hypothetical protein
VVSAECPAEVSCHTGSIHTEGQQRRTQRPSAAHTLSGAARSAAAAAVCGGHTQRAAGTWPSAQAVEGSSGRPALLPTVHPGLHLPARARRVPRYRCLLPSDRQPAHPQPAALKAGSGKCQGQAAGREPAGAGAPEGRPTHCCASSPRCSHMLATLRPARQHVRAAVDGGAVAPVQPAATWARRRPAKLHSPHDQPHRSYLLPHLP